MSPIELCTLAQEHAPESPQAAKWWLEWNRLTSQGQLRTARGPQVDGPPDRPPARLDQASQVMAERLKAEGWLPLLGGYYRQPANGSAPISSELEHLLNIVLERTERGEIEKRLGNILRDMLIELITLQATGDLLYSPPAADDDAALENRRGKLDDGQLERRKSRKAHKPAERKRWAKAEGDPWDG